MSATLITVKPSELEVALEDCLKATPPLVPCVWGEPGLGKSAIFRQVTERNGYSFKDLRAILLDPTDITGLPYVENGRTRHAAPRMLPGKGEGKVFILWDEPNRAQTLTQNALFQVVHDNAAGEHELYEESAQGMACNYETDGGGVSKMPLALCNRVVHYHLVCDYKDWSKWAVRNNVHEFVLAYIRSAPDALHEFTKDAKQFPSPRAWEKLSNLLHGRPSKDMYLKHFTGIVGNGRGTEFDAFMKMTGDLPNIIEIFNNPHGARIPKQSSANFAVATALARHATPDNFDAAVIYLNRLQPEYATCGIRDSVTRTPDLLNTTAFINWSAEHEDFVV